MLWFALGLSVHLFVCLPGLLGQPVLCVPADLRYLLLFKLQTFLSLAKQSLSRPCLSPGLLIDPLPLCKKCPAVKLAVFVDVRTNGSTGLHMGNTVWCVRSLAWLTFSCDCLKFCLRAELISLLFREIVCEFTREFTTGQNLGSEKFTSSSACVVTAVCLHGKTFLNVFNKRGMIHNYSICFF